MKTAGIFILMFVEMCAACATVAVPMVLLSPLTGKWILLVAISLVAAVAGLITALIMVWENQGETNGKD